MGIYPFCAPRPYNSPVRTTAQTLIDESRAMLAPLVQALIRQGITYPQFTAAMKQVFLEVARQELRARQQRETDSAVSVLSGVHRKDVRAAAADSLQPMALGLTLASQIFTRWITDPAYRDRRNRPIALARTGEVRSFEALASSASTDVHPRTALEELVRLGMVTVAKDKVRLNTSAFVPKKGFGETAALFSRNVADHIAAGAHNLEHEEKFLEQSVFAAGLTAQSTEGLGEIARELWAQAFQRMVARAQKRVDADRAKADAFHRMRFGVYFYAARDDAAETTQPKSAGKVKAARRKSSS